MNQRQTPKKHAVIPRASANGGNPYQYPWDDDGEYDDVWPPPTPRSAIRYTTTNPEQEVYTQGNRRIVVHRVPPPKSPIQKHRVHWMVFVGLTMLTMLFGWVALTLASIWWQTQQDDWHYGRPRTYQVDQVVGHNDSSTHPTHFIALNLKRQIEVIEIPGGDAIKEKVYLGPLLYGDGQDLTPVTLTFKDVNGDGKLDMEIHVLDQTIVFLNENGQFRPLKQG